MSDYFSFAAARVGPADPHASTVRPPKRPATLDAVDDPFETVEGPEPHDTERPDAARHDPTPPREAARPWGAPPAPTGADDIRPPPEPGPRRDEPTATPTPPRPASAPTDDATRPQHHDDSTPPLLEPRPLTDITRASSQPEDTGVLAAVEPPPPGAEAPASEPHRDERNDASPEPDFPPPAPADPAEALAMADAFMREAIEPRPEPAPAPPRPPADERPRVVIDEVTVEIVEPARDTPAPPRARVPRAAARLPAGSRTSWGS